MMSIRKKEGENEFVSAFYMLCPMHFYAIMELHVPQIRFSLDFQGTTSTGYCLYVYELQNLPPSPSLPGIMQDFSSVYQV